MKAREIKTGIYWVGAVDWDRRLFDELIPLPDGTSYNSYLVKGSEKTAAFAKAQESGDRIPIGLIYRKERPVYEEHLPALKKMPLVKQKIDPL
jgi:hypothetical protein